MERIGIYSWSGIGDTLLALPLIQGLTATGREPVPVGNARLEPLYEFLRESGVIGRWAAYEGRSPRRWLRAAQGVDDLLLPPELSFRDHAAGSVLAALAPAANPILRAIGIPGIRRIPDVRVPSRSPKAPIVANLSLSYRRFLTAGFGLRDDRARLFLPEAVLTNAEARASAWLERLGLSERPYAVLYPRTKDSTRSLPAEPLKHVLRWARERGLKLLWIGGAADAQAHASAAARLSADEASFLIDGCGKAGFAELAGAITSAALTFSIDGGLLHLALACGGPVVSFWGPTIPESRVSPDHPSHAPLCRYLPFQPYLGEPLEDSLKNEAFDFSFEEIAQAADRVAGFHAP